jgi:hypothetical protein
MASAEIGPEAVRAHASWTSSARTGARAASAEAGPAGEDVIQDIERTIPTAEVDRSDLPV